MDAALPSLGALPDEGGPVGEYRPPDSEDGEHTMADGPRLKVRPPRFPTSLRS